MRKVLSVILAVSLLLTMAACGKKEQVLPDGDVGEYQSPDSVTSPAAIAMPELSEEAKEWREKVLSSPKIAEAYYLGVLYEVYVYETVKYTYNTETWELNSVSTQGDIRGTVLRDWVAPYGETDLVKEDALFETCWANTGSRLRSLIGYYDTAKDASGNPKFTLVTRARTAEYVEYVYKDKDEVYYRIAATDDYILYAPLVFMYIFDIGSY